MIALGTLGLAWLLAALALDRHGLRRPAGRFDAIVVAGCRVTAEGEPTPALRRRCELAAELWREGHAPTVVLTGGVGAEGPSEASVAARVVRALGVPDDAILLEERSTSTEENARHAASVLSPAARVLVVSDAYHVFRCERVFARHFAAARGVGSRGQPWPRAQGALREVLAIAIYGLLGRL
ncbi:MAG: YdcF family protein [Myxococcales bacterium]|nr:YdcF family protein [Myxococcales bacterium]